MIRKQRSRILLTATRNKRRIILTSEWLLMLLTGLTTGTQYNYRAWIFWASWDSTYKLRVEAWDSTFTTEIFASNVDTTNGTDSLNLTTSGTSGYFTIGTLRSDNPGGTAEMSGSGVELDAAQVQSVTP